MYEYYTIGGGWYLYNFFSAVAAISKSAEFKYALAGAMLVSGGWVLFMLAFQAKWNIATNWMAVSIIVVSALMAPDAKVKITDKINTVDSSSYIVSDVPYGLALFASLTSRVGDQLTTLFETNFSDVNSPSMQNWGFLFGSRLMAEATRIEIKDEHFERTLSSFIRNCLFYDILQGRKSFDKLKTADDPWAYMISDPSVARMFEISTAGTGSAWSREIKTCSEGVKSLTTKWTAQTKDAERRLVLTATTNRGNKPASAVNALIKTELGSFHEYLIGASRTSSQILQRQMTINAIMREPANWLAERGNDAALKDYIDARLQLQTRESYKSIGRQAERWVANLKAVFQCLYIGIFPIAAMLMLSPMGAAIFKNYVFGLVWIESWGALYALLNYMMNSKARQDMRAVIEAANAGSNDITLFAQAGIQQVEADIAVMAGYLSMSIPFISLALATGAGRFAYLASSTLAVSQEAVGETTREAVTGNLQVGNTQHDSHSFHQYSGFHNNTSLHWDSDRSSSYADSGALVTQTGDGRTVINSGSSWSSTPTDIKFSDSLSSSYSQSASASRQAAETASTSLGQREEAVQSNMSSFAETISKDITDKIQYDQGSSFSASEDFRTMQEHSQRLAESHGVSGNEALNTMVAAQVSAQVLGNGLQARAAYEASTNSKISYDDALNASKNESFSDALQRTMNASSSKTAAWSDGENTSFSETMQASYQEIKTLTQNREASLQQAGRLEKAAQNIRANSAGIDQNLNQFFYEWLADQPGSTGYAMGLTQAQSLLTSTDLADQGIVQGYAKEFVNLVATGHIKDVPALDLESGFSQTAQGIQSTNIQDRHEENTRLVPEVDGNAASAAASTKAGVEANINQRTGEMDVKVGEVENKLEATRGEVEDAHDIVTPNKLVETIGDNIEESWDTLKSVNQKDDASPLDEERWGGYYEQDNAQQSPPIPSRMGQPQSGGWEE